jgi:hypothetical protein
MPAQARYRFSISGGYLSNDTARDVTPHSPVIASFVKLFPVPVGFLLSKSREILPDAFDQVYALHYIMYVQSDAFDQVYIEY